MNDQRLLAASVGAKADLRSVALRSVMAELDPPGDDAQIELVVSWETEFEIIEVDTLEYRYRLAVADSGASGFEIRAEFVLTYTVPDAPALTTDQLEAFGDISVAFSGYPYARELVQSLTTRASLPPLVLGTLRAPIDPPLEQAPEEKPTAKATPKKRAATKRSAAKS